jgi:hypothetical protein
MPRPMVPGAPLRSPEASAYCSPMSDFTRDLCCEGILYSFSELGITVRDAVLHLASLLRLPQAPGLFCVVLVAVLGVVSICFLLSVREKSELLRRITRLVRQYHDAASLRENVGEVSRIMDGWKGKSAKHLRETWSEFRETTLDPRAEGGGIQNAVRPSVFFNLEDMGFGVAGWRFWPGLFVSIGLAATFLGLIAALQETGESLKAGGDPSIVMTALTQLLTVASAKFIMSLTGLLCSIFFTVILRISTRILDEAIRTLAHEIERRMQFVSLEDIAEQQLTAIIANREHSEKLNRDLIAAISEPLQKALGSSADQVDKMVQNIAGSLTDGLVAAMTITSDRLDAASGKLAGLATDLSEAAAKFATAAESTAVGLDTASKRLEIVSDNLSKAGNGLANAAEPIALAAEKTAETTQQIASASIDMVASARATMASEKEVVINAANLIRDQIRSFEGRAAAYDGQLEKAFKSFSEEIARSIGEVENHSNNVHGQYADALATLQSVIENAKTFQPESERPIA